MIRIGLTGSIAMGKTTVAAMFAEAGVPVFDADAEVRAMQAPGGALERPILSAFPGATDADGNLDRTALAATVLGDPAALARLEAIVHPAVAERRAAFLDRHRDARALLFDVPLLFETGGEKAVDKVVVVSAPADVQRARALARGLTPARLDAILARQMPDAEKRARADFVIDTGGDLSTTKRQVGAVLACLGLAET